MPTAPYYVKGKRVPGVTTVLKNLGWSSQGLMIWSNKMGMEGMTLEQARSVAMDVGTQVHAWIEQLAKSGEEPTPDIFEENGEAWRAFLAWRDWADGKELDPIAIEESLLSEEMRVGGTPDLIARGSDGRVCLYDWKTYGSKDGMEKSPWAEYWIQAVAYATMWNESKEPKINDVSIVMIDKNEGVATEFRESLESPRSQAALECFLMARRLHDLQKEITKEKKEKAE